MVVEVEPSRMPTALLLLVPAPLLRCADSTLWCRGETAWFPQVRFRTGWWTVWWRAPERPRGRWGSGEILVGLADTDAAAPEGVVGPSWRASGPPFLASHRVLGETLGSSVVVVASLLGGVAWCRHSGVLELGGSSPVYVGAAVARLLRFSLICRSRHFLLLCFLFRFFWT